MERARRGAPRQPFLRHEFLLALEEAGCTTPRTGWTPEHADCTRTSRAGCSGAVPLYRKAHSRGEFVFDFSWANAYAQHGLEYYPKLLSAVPFTPVSGTRILVAPAVDARATRAALIRAAREHARAERLSSWHVLFPADSELADLTGGGLIPAARLPVSLVQSRL